MSARARKASSGRPWGGPSPETALRRAITQALEQDCWGPAALNQIAAKVLNSVAPEAAVGAVAMVREAFVVGDPQTAQLRLQLLGALCVPGWREDALAAIGRVLKAAAQDGESGRSAEVRAALEGMRL